MRAENKINNILKNDEEIVWMGQPIEKKSKKTSGGTGNFVFKIFYLVTALSFLTLSLVIIKDIIFITITSILSAAGLIWVFGEKILLNKNIGKTYYVVTNRRLILFLDQRKMKYWEQNIIDTDFIEELAGPKGSKTLVFCKSADFAMQTYEKNKTYKQFRREDYYASLAFKNIADYKNVVDVVKKQKEAMKGITLSDADEKKDGLIIEQNIMDILEYDEEILWFSRPADPAKYMPRIVIILLKCFVFVFTGAICLSPFINILIYGKMTFFEKALITVEALLVIYVGYQIFKSPYTDYRKVVYCITDKRIISCENKIKPKYEVQNIADTVSIEEKRSGIGTKTLIFYKSREDKYPKSDKKITYKQLKESGFFSRIVFKDIVEYANVISIVKKQKEKLSSQIVETFENRY